jgi:eukaryotic-like serine/threonine-protein kinase
MVPMRWEMGREMPADRLLSEPRAGGHAPQSQGRLIGRRYRLVSPVGRGGMGVVWQAHDVLLDRTVAVKELILPFGLDHAGKQAAHRRVMREARSAARLAHPGIVTVHDVAEEDGRPWIVMELVRSWSLEQAVRQSGPLPVLQAAEIGIRVLDALGHAHAAGILHRDVKPGNVLLTADRVVLTDFGIAAIEGDLSVTQTGLVMGSPAYVPPERLSGQQVTPAADLWSFGATLYAAVEGRPPYEGPDAVAVLGAVLTHEPAPARRAGELLPVIEGLLRKEPSARLTVPQVAELLERVLLAHGSRPPRQQDGLRAGGVSAVPLEPPSGPMPSRIVETPTGPVRVPSEGGPSPSGGYMIPSTPAGPAFDAFTSTSAPLPTAAPPFGNPPSGDTPGSPPPGSAVPDSAVPGSAGSVAPGPAAPGGPGFGDPAFRRAPFGGAAPGGAVPPSTPATFHNAGGADGPSAVGASSGPQPILPLTSDSRSALWPLTSGDGAKSGGRAPAKKSSGRSGRKRRRANGWVRKGRPTPRLIVTTVAGVGAVTAAVLFATVGGSPDTSAPAPAATSAPLPSAAAPIPDGYTEQTASGFTAGVPKGWKPGTSDGIATFTGPEDSGMKITVEQTAPQADGGVAELTKEEADSGVEDYAQIHLQPVEWRGWKSADWEYTHKLANGVPTHTQTRFATVDDKTAFKITISMPDLAWNDQTATRATFLATFRPNS